MRIIGFLCTNQYFFINMIPNIHTWQPLTYELKEKEFHLSMTIGKGSSILSAICLKSFLLCWNPFFKRDDSMLFQRNVSTFESLFESRKFSTWEGQVHKYQTQLCGKEKHELRVAGYEFRYTSYEFKSTSCELKSTSCEFKSTSRKFKSMSCEFKSTNHEFNTRVKRLKARAGRSKARVEAIKPRVK